MSPKTTARKIPESKCPNFREVLRLNILKRKRFKERFKMDRLLRLSGAGLGGMGGAQQPADAPVVDTAEQVFTTYNFDKVQLLEFKLSSSSC